MSNLGFKAKQPIRAGFRASVPRDFSQEELRVRGILGKEDCSGRDPALVTGRKLENLGSLSFSLSTI